MALIAPLPVVALKNKRVRCLAPGPAIPDGDGGFTQGLTPLTPEVVYAHVRPAALRDLERMAAGTVITQASHVVELDYRPDLDTTCELHVEDHPRPDRRLAIVAILNPLERSAFLQVLCSEVVP